MVQRLTYRKRHSYATKSNQHRVVKTPGIVIHIYIYTHSKPTYTYTYYCIYIINCDILDYIFLGFIEEHMYMKKNVILFWFLFVCMFWLGGKLVYQSTKKRASGPKCPVTGKRIQGVCFSFSSFLNIIFGFGLFSICEIYIECNAVQCNDDMFLK